MFEKLFNEHFVLTLFGSVALTWILAEGLFILHHHYFSQRKIRKIRP